MQLLDLFKKREYPEIDGLTNLPSSPAKPFMPVWGEVTSTIDWCEENYVQSSFIAEFCNTLSNMSYIAVSIFLYYRLSYKLDIRETRLKLTMAGLLLVGLGSAMFHMSLRYDCQLLDELPMIYITCIPCYSVLCEPLLYQKEEPTGEDENTQLLKNKTDKRFKVSKSFEVTVALFLTLLSLIITLSYLFYITNPVFHEVCYAVLNAIIVYCSACLTIKHIHDPKTRQNLAKAAFIGVGLFGFGFLLWGLDIQYCGSLRYIRREYLKLPLGNVLELHAYWHLFTGIGLYYILNFLIFLRINLHNKKEGDVYYGTSFRLEWVFFGLVPLLRK